MAATPEPRTARSTYTLQRPRSEHSPHTEHTQRIDSCQSNSPASFSGVRGCLRFRLQLKFLSSAVVSAADASLRAAAAAAAAAAAEKRRMQNDSVALASAAD